MIKFLFGICAAIIFVEAAQAQSYSLELAKYVSKDGWVDYKSWKGNDAGLQSFITEAKTVEPSRLNDNDRKAFYINVYNALTIDLILSNYPLKSITDLEKPWDRKIIQLKSKGELSLNGIENNILRKEWNDPRIHFAINCASYSCPKLYNTPFIGSKLDEQLDAAAKSFFADNLRNNLEGSSWKVSKIFDWFSDDFKSLGGPSEFIKRYSNQPKIKTIEFLDYNWALNSQNN